MLWWSGSTSVTSPLSLQWTFSNWAALAMSSIQPASPTSSPLDMYGLEMWSTTSRSPGNLPAGNNYFRRVETGWRGFIPMTGTCFSMGGLTRQSNTRPSSMTTWSPLWTSSLSSQSSLSTSRMCLTPTNSLQDLIWDLRTSGSLVQMSDCQIIER